MSASIFIRSYAKDFGWLQYCLRSLAKFARGFDEIVIAVPQGQQHLLSHLTAERVIPVHDAQPGYLGQQVSKLNADLHTRGDFILHIDSDCILTRPVTPESFMEGGKARWLIKPFKACAKEERRAWMHVMTKCLQDYSPYEFMRKNTIFAPRWAYGAFRQFIQDTHGIPMDAYVMNQPGSEFSEYNCLGFYLWLHHRSKIAWHDTEIHGVPDIGEKQFWSWRKEGIDAQIKTTMEAALA